MATGVGEEGPTGFRRSARRRRRRPGALMTEAAQWGSSRVLQCSGAEVHGDEPRTWVSTGVGRGPGGGGVGGDGMKNLQGTVAIEIADRGWKIYRVLNILLWRVKFRVYHYR